MASQGGQRSEGSNQNGDDNVQPASALDGLRRGEHSTSSIQRSMRKTEVTLKAETLNGASGTSDIEGKVTRVGASECGQRMSFKR